MSLPPPFKRLLGRILAVALSAGFTSCGMAGDDWQTLQLPALGELKVRHSRVLTASDTEKASAFARQLIQWTRGNAWVQLRVRVDDKHPLVTKLKAGPVLLLTPEDPSLPLIWCSLDPKNQRALIEDRGTGSLAIKEPPQGSALDLSWLGQ